MDFVTLFDRLKSVAPEFKLRAYYNLVGIASIFVPFFIGLGILFYPKYFSWFVYPRLMMVALFGVAIFQIFIFVLHKIFQKPIFWTLLAGGWVLFYFATLIASGGTKSTLIFILIMPLLASTIRLREKEIKIVGVLLTIGLSLSIFFTPSYLSDPAIISQHIVQVILFALIVFYFVRIVSETVSYKIGEEETKQQLLDVMELDQIKKTFLMVASHQLRTPLSAARWALDELARDEKISPENRVLLDSGRDRIARSLAIVSDLLKSAEITTSKYAAEKQRGEIDLRSVMKDLKKDALPLAARSWVKLSFINAKDKAVILGNSSFLYGALLNLVDNAIRYSPQKTVRVSLTQKDKQIIFEVADTGMGISDEDQEHIFDQFYRGKNAIALDPDGSGLGLTITKRMVELSGGIISFKSKLGEGTTFTVTFPAA